VSNAREGADRSHEYVLTTYELYLDIVAHYDKGALIEITGTYAADELKSVVSAAIQKIGYRDLTLMSSFLASLEAVAACDPYVRTVVTAPNALLAYAYTQMNHSVALNVKLCSEATVRRAHKAQTAVFVCDVDTPALAAQAVEKNVDFILTAGVL